MIHDISMRIGKDTVPWPGMSPVAEQTIFADTNRGDAVTGSSWNLNSHVGTHVDAPRHLLGNGGDIASTPLQSCIGPCVVVDLPTLDRDIEASDLELIAELRDHVRVIFKTSNSRRLLKLPQFEKDYVALAPSAAHYLADHGYRLAGIDYQGIERFDTTDYETHKTLLGGGCAILEGADLREVEPGQYFLLCVPLRLEGGEASPVRAVLIDPGDIAAMR